MHREPSAQAPAEKEQALRDLAEKRKAAEKCRPIRFPGYIPLADYHDGVYECAYVSPWSKSAHNVDAELLIVGHDWSSSERLKGPVDQESAERGYSSRFPTNKNLFGLLDRHFGLCFGDVYATNAFPFVKQGPAQGAIGAEDMRTAAREFLLPQIKIIEPVLVICLGQATFDAVRFACGCRRTSTLDEAIKSPFKFRESFVYAVAHTGSRGMNNRQRNQVEQDWALLRCRLDELRSVS